jgi:outer membrane protein OmpA-like peptidoglycan-associated protein
MKQQMMTGAAILGALWLGGCATQDYVDKHVATVQGQVDTVKGHAQDQDERIGAADKTAHEALQRAIEAGKLAQGKFLYSMVLTLSDEAKSRLTEFATKLKSDNRPVYLEIQGYTDSTGAPAANLALGAARAEAVRLFLNEQGVALNRMATISYGIRWRPTTPRTAAPRTGAWSWWCWTRGSTESGAIEFQTQRFIRISPMKSRLPSGTPFERRMS